MPDNRWGALGLGGFLSRALGLDQPSVLDRMAEQGRMQRERFARGERGPAPPGSPEAMAGLDVAGSVDLGGILAGPKALTAPLEQLTKAQKAQARGWKPQTIWEKYGWFEGPDKQWRFEIDDSAAKTLDTPRSWEARNASDLSSKENIPQAASLEEVFSHPRLERAYFPTRESTPDVYYTPLPAGQRGAFQSQGGAGPGQIIIADQIAGGAPERSTMLHELQHLIQERERFAGGANPKEFQGTYDAYKKQLLQRDALWKMRNRIQFAGETPIEASEKVAKTMGVDAEELRRRHIYMGEDELLSGIEELNRLIKEF